MRSLKALKGATGESNVTLRLIDDGQALGLSCKDGTAMLVMPLQVETRTTSWIQPALRDGGPPVHLDRARRGRRARGLGAHGSEMADAYDAFGTAAPAEPASA
ncbi:MAG: hypothetical protein R3E76_14790 [Planctomycetota bacterium]